MQTKQIALYPNTCSKSYVCTYKVLKCVIKNVWTMFSRLKRGIFLYSKTYLLTQIVRNYSFHLHIFYIIGYRTAFHIFFSLPAESFEVITALSLYSCSCINFMDVEAFSKLLWNFHFCYTKCIPKGVFVFYFSLRWLIHRGLTGLIIETI